MQIRSTIKKREVFRYVPEQDNFEPNGIQDLMQRSSRLKQAGYMLSINASTDLQKRTSLLDTCVQQNASTIQQVSGILGRYYKQK